MKCPENGCPYLCRLSLISLSFPGNEPNDASNNAKINMVMKMFLQSPFYFSFYAAFSLFSLSLSLYLLHTGWNFATPGTPSVQRVHMNLTFKFMGRYINTFLAVQLAVSLGTPGASTTAQTRTVLTPRGVEIFRDKCKSYECSRS